MARSISVNNLHLHLDNLIAYLEPYLTFVNCHMVSYLSDHLWSTHIPINIQEEIQTEDDIHKSLEIFWNSCNPTENDLINPNHFQNFRKFLRNSHKLHMQNMQNICVTPEQLSRELIAIGCSHDGNWNEEPLQIKEFMSAKKGHEVELTAQLVTILCSYRFGDDSDEQLCVIDAGDGKGYLSSRVALEYRLNVLGIDANDVNTEGAIKRSTKLEKAWIGLTKRAENIKNGLTPPRKGRRRSNQSLEPQQKNNPTLNYQTTTHFITPQTDFMALFQNYFPIERPVGFCLSGLHTCGNLAASCLKIFVQNPNISSLCNIGCCYHLLSEEFQQDDFFVNRQPKSHDSDFGFPMSEYLRQKKFHLGRNARMLASQSLNRTVTNQELPNKSLFYRALLEILITQANAEMKNCVQVGRIKKYTTFSDYVEKCSSQTGLHSDEDQLMRLLKTYEHESKLLNLFYLIRMSFAPILEAIILLDRLLYLKESLTEHVFLVPLFNPVVSPRSYGIVALKGKSKDEK